jgi:curved DNA-binding protein CbpA
MELCDYINSTHDLYLILSVPRKATTEIIRRAFLTKSRLIHPDKLPLYPSSTPAFQRLSFAYETLSKTASRRMYDLGGGRYDMSDTRSSTTAEADDETLNGVLRSVFAEFLEGDFEMIRVFVSEYLLYTMAFFFL